MARPFLTARWSNLCIISYRVPRAMLEGYLPRGLELDAPPGTPPDMGAVSLVAFDFLETRVRGVRWPGHVNFPEINLRFYVVQRGGPGAEERRGVVFIREFVPKGLISLVARSFYNEPYAAAMMTSRVTTGSDSLMVQHRMKRKNRESLIELRASAQRSTPPSASLEHWFKEHQWGFGRTRHGDPVVYEVRHPIWAVHAVRSHHLDFDWAGAYGGEWGMLRDAQPISVVLAEGSQIEVHPKRSLKGASAPSA